MKKLPMLSVPLKETESIDWSTPLRHYIASVYGNWNEFADETQEFNKLRNEVIGCNHDNVGLSFYYRYYSQLLMLDLRVPVREIGGVNILFTWSDSFSDSSKVSQHSLPFEKASMLFNLAALLSTVADSQYHNHSTDDVEDDTQNFKNALSNYQNAAGVFQFVSENFLHAPSNDMNQTTVKFLAKLMLAQAQEVFSLNLIINKPDNANSSLLAKLFQSTSSFYKAAYDLLSALIKDELWYSSYQNWYNIVNVKKHYFEGLANYYQSLVSSKSNKYGDAIAYMKNALDTLGEIKLIPLATHSSEHDTKQNYVELLKRDATKELIEKLQKELQLLEKDNDYIYHDNVPQKFNLPAIKAMDAVKPAKLEAQIDSPFNKYRHAKDLFEKIIPLKIHELNSMYSEEKAKRLRATDDNINVANEALNSFYEYLKLPKSLIDLKTLFNENSPGGGSSSDTDFEYREFYKLKIKPLIVALSLKKDVDFNSLFNERTKALELLSKCEHLLKEDEQTYNRNKLKYGASWSIQDPSVASMNFTSELIKVKQNLIDAENSDRPLYDKFSKIEKLYKLLKNPTSSKEEIKAVFTSEQHGSQQPSLIDFDTTNKSLLDLDDGSINSARNSINDLESHWNALNHLKKESGLIFADYKAKIHEDDISNVLIFNKGLTEEQIKNVIFAKELEKFEPYELRISKIIQKQEEIMGDIQSAFDALNANPSIKEKRIQFAQKQRKKLKMYETVNHFERDFKIIETGIKNGVEFYGRLAAHLNQLQIGINAFIVTRNDESAQLSHQLEFGDARKPSIASNNSHQDSINERLSKLNLSSSSIPTTTTTNNNIYSSDIANQNRYSSISTTTWNQAPLIPKKSSISDPISSPELSYYQQQPQQPPALPQFPTGQQQQQPNLQSFSSLYGSYAANNNNTTGGSGSGSFGNAGQFNPGAGTAGGPPALPPKRQADAPQAQYGVYPQQPQYPGYLQQQQSQQPQQQPLQQQQQLQQQPSMGAMQEPQQTGIPFYNTPSNYSANMYSMFDDKK